MDEELDIDKAIESFDKTESLGFKSGSVCRGSQCSERYNSELGNGAQAP
jgi:hypothetical protein